MDPKRDAFPSAVLTEDYMLALNRQEIVTLRSHFATSNPGREGQKPLQKKANIYFAIHSESEVYNYNFLKYDFLKNYNKC